MQTFTVVTLFSKSLCCFFHRLSHAQRSAVKVLRRMQYFVARKKFQVSGKKHDGEKEEDDREVEKDR